ncbi:hypothetical protein VB716_03365 [Synechococcus sp. CCY9201]|uniref:hypothetical protein n=1 Tax=Synechococcus sp. CCY9201 TaxID=174697 RepID=UPI002B21A82F|nr:hypothetical protein [Synechococcus sp. CCY9201]MEA5473253.1 hypothetical protein [Synechococcus sp. CCY9201]
MVNLNGGYGGNSVVLMKPQVTRAAFSRSPVVRRKIRTALAPELRRQLARIRRQYHAVLRARDPYWLTPAELRRDQAIATACLASLQDFLRQLHSLRREVPEAAELVPVVLLWLQQLVFEIEDCVRFDRVMLGSPTAAEIEALTATPQEVAA